MLAKLSHWLDRILSTRARLAVLGAGVLLLVASAFPLWRITMFANQFPEGLRLSIYSYKLVGGGGGADLEGINILNHYIGMREIAAADFVEMKFIPFVLGALFLLSLRTMVFARLRDLVDLTVLLLYFSAFSFGLFWYRMYAYGHHLNPEAAIKVAPFTPPLFGHQHLANFDIYSFPGIGTFLMVGVALGLVALIVLDSRVTRPHS
jgi:copper chaperone NosL